MNKNVIPEKKIPEYLVTISDAARMTGKDRVQIRRDIKSGKLKMVLFPAKMPMIDTRKGYIADCK